MIDALKIARQNFQAFVNARQAFHEPGGNWYSVDMKADTEAEIFIYGPIGFFGVEAESLVKEIAALEVDRITVRINSPGGEVFDGIAIYNALRSHSAEIYVRIEALAASMATIIALAGDSVEMEDNAYFMIHKPFAFCIGNETDMEKMRDILSKLGGTMADIYSAKSDLSRDEVLAKMSAESWYTAAEALDAGFIDAVVERDGDESKAASAYDLSVFSKAPAEIRAAARADKDLTERSLEGILRDAGFSGKEARRQVAGFKSRLLRDAEDNDNDGQSLIDMARQSINTLTN